MTDVTGTAPVAAQPVAAPTQTAPVGTYVAPVQPMVMKQDPAAVRQIKMINHMLFAFAIFHFIGAVLFLAGNCAALNGPSNHNKYQAGLRLYVSGSTVMCFASIILFTAHLMDFMRSRRLGITNFLVYSAMIVSFTFVFGYLLWAIGGGMLLRSYHQSGTSGENNKRAAGLDLITIGTFLAAIGVFHSFVGHWGALEARSRNRVSHHTFSPSHLRSWAMSAGNFDFMIGWVIYVVAALAAATNANNYANFSFLYELFIVGIITSIFFMLGDLRTLYLTSPSRALYSDMAPYGAPGPIADPYPAAVATPVAAV